MTILINEASLALLAEIYLKNNDLTNAINQADAAINKDNDYAPAYIICAQANKCRGDSDGYEASLQLMEEQSEETVPVDLRCFYKAYLSYTEKNYREAFFTLNFQNYHRIEYIDDQAFAYLGGINMIACAKSERTLGFIENTSRWMDALKIRGINIMACPSLSQEEKKYIKGLDILSKNITALELVIFEKCCNKNRADSNEGSTDLILETLTEFKRSLTHNLPAILRGEDTPLRSSFIFAKTPTFEEAKQALTAALEAASEELNKKSQAGRIVANIFIALGLLGVGYLIAGCVNLYRTNGRHFAFFPDEELRTVENITDQITSSRSPFCIS